MLDCILFALELEEFVANLTRMRMFYIKVSSKCIDPSISRSNEARAKMSSGVYIEVNEHANRVQNKIIAVSILNIFLKFLCYFLPMNSDLSMPNEKLGSMHFEETLVYKDFYEYQ